MVSMVNGLYNAWMYLEEDANKTENNLNSLQLRGQSCES